MARRATPRTGVSAPCYSQAGRAWRQPAQGGSSTVRRPFAQQPLDHHQREACRCDQCHDAKVVERRHPGGLLHHLLAQLRHGELGGFGRVAQDSEMARQLLQRRGQRLGSRARGSRSIGRIAPCCATACTASPARCRRRCRTGPACSSPGWRARRSFVALQRLERLHRRGGQHDDHEGAVAQQRRQHAAQRIGRLRSGRASCQPPSSSAPKPAR